MDATRFIESQHKLMPFTGKKRKTIVHSSMKWRGWDSALQTFLRFSLDKLDLCAAWLF